MTEKYIKNTIIYIMYKYIELIITKRFVINNFNCLRKMAQNQKGILKMKRKHFVSSDNLPVIGIDFKAFTFYRAANSRKR